jgi:hypothetical protein
MFGRLIVVFCTLGHCPVLITSVQEPHHPTLGIWGIVPVLWTQISCFTVITQIFLRDTHVLSKLVSYQEHCRRDRWQTHRAVLLHSISGVSAINPLVAFCDIMEERELLFFYCVQDTARENLITFIDFYKKRSKCLPLATMHIQHLRCFEMETDWRYLELHNKVAIHSNARNLISRSIHNIPDPKCGGGSAHVGR